MYFLSSRIFEQLALALKTEFALKFFKPWGATAPWPPASYAYGNEVLLRVYLSIYLLLRYVFQSFYLWVIIFYLSSS